MVLVFEPLEPGFVILQSNPLLYKLASWNKQDSDKTDCVSTRLQSDCAGKQLTVAEGVVSWTRQNQKCSDGSCGRCVLGVFNLSLCVGTNSLSESVEGREYRRNLHYVVQLVAHLSENS